MHPGDYPEGSYENHEYHGGDLPSAFGGPGQACCEASLYGGDCRHSLSSEEYDLQEIPLDRYAQDASMIRRATDTQEVNETTIFGKMMVDYPHFAAVPLEDAMMNLLYEADLVNRNIHPEGVVSKDGLSRLDFIPFTGNQAHVLAGISTRTENGPEYLELQYRDGRLNLAPDALEKVHGREDARLTDSEGEVFDAANVLLTNNVKRQVIEISESLKWLKDNKPGLLTNIRAGAVLKREEIIGYSGSSKGWSFTVKPKNFSLNADGGVDMMLNTIMSRGGVQIDTMNRAVMSKTTDSLDVSTFEGYRDFPQQDSVPEAKSAHAEFFTKSSTVQHYASLTKTILPLIKAKMVREMDAYVAPAKKLAATLNNEITLLEQSISRPESRAFSKNR